MSPHREGGPGGAWPVWARLWGVARGGAWPCWLARSTPAPCWPLRAAVTRSPQRRLPPHPTPSQYRAVYFLIPLTSFAVSPPPTASIRRFNNRRRSPHGRAKGGAQPRRGRCGKPARGHPWRPPSLGSAERPTTSSSPQLPQQRGDLSEVARCFKGWVFTDGLQSNCAGDFVHDVFMWKRHLAGVVASVRW